MLLFIAASIAVAGCGNGLLEGPADGGQPFLSNGVITTTSGAGKVASESYKGRLSVGNFPGESTIESEKYQYTFDQLPAPQQEVKK